MSGWNRLPGIQGVSDASPRGVGQRVQQAPMYRDMQVALQPTPEQSRLSSAQATAWNDPELRRMLMMYYLQQQQNVLPAGFSGVVGY